ncbi:MAG: nuclear transport factor 2 family protein [Pseudomonadota bacterium]
MNNTEIFEAYFDAFEAAYQDDQWDRLLHFFTDDMVYNNVEGESLKGRTAAIDYLEASVNASDRKFDSRGLDDVDIVGDGDTVTMAFTVRYQIAGAPDLVISGRETATFRDGRIEQMDDIFHDASLTQFGAWMEIHAGLLA